MRSVDEHSYIVDGPTDRELRFLNAVNRDPHVSQRELSRQLGIALGMTNILLHNLAQKGYVRMTKAGWQRWLYALTPEGFLRKVQLTLSYIDRFLGHYQKVRQTLREELAVQSLHAESKVAIYGTGEFAELVFLGLKELGVDEVNFFDDEGLPGSKFLGMPVQAISSFRPDQYERVVIAQVGDVGKPLLALFKIGAEPEQCVTFFNDATTSLVI